MRVCLICTEFFGLETRGGFGYATRVIGLELVKKGIDVYAVIPRPRTLDKPRIELDGVKVFTVERDKPFSAIDIYREINADVYHSQQPSLASYVAQRAEPGKVHLATLRDPRSWQDWWKEFRHPTHSKLQVLKTCLYYENPLARHAISNMHALFVPANYLVEKSCALYGLVSAPAVLPTPVFVPQSVEKAQKPTLLFVGRWDRVKRPWRFFDLAKDFPDVEFLAIGSAHNQDYELELRKRYSNIPNLQLIGYVDQFANNSLSNYLSTSWILVNTSAKEALPNTFVEACAHRCAIISSLDPDGFASNFGALVVDDDFSKAISYLLENNRWREKGLAGFDYVRARNELGAAADAHISAYRKLTDCV